ncbi:PREDICTED: PWWP domain-containing protein 2A-like [Ceratosolen solmsi marchali]|uniref:PWWP domain-containing protein 2A-like n=1 Tax=Ceratosolen solmsi marchali TaxID=326594 RepID=A0AAJ7E3F5_9HYME|nr:PREDICTED: PWWP domain-containing protein 2A-like [Ceratosolen solmsi marchali]
MPLPRHGSGHTSCPSCAAPASSAPRARPGAEATAVPAQPRPGVTSSSPPSPLSPGPPAGPPRGGPSARAMDDEGGPRGSRCLLPGERILVTVESALPDILVVSYEHGAKSFQGALLDATKRGLPCGVQPPEPIKGPDGDKLASIAARFSYFQEKRHTTLAKSDQRRSVNPPARSKSTRPTVRLRPRQVLCSKCRSICNENSENVGRKRKPEEQSHADLPTRRSDRRCGSQQQQQQQHQQQQQQHQQRLLNVGDQSDESSSSKTTSSSQSDQPATAKFSSTLIPKISRLRPTEIDSAIQSAGSVKSCIQLAEQVRSVYWNGRDEEDLGEAEEEMENRPMNALSRAEPMELDSNPTQAYCATPRRLSSSSVESAKVPPDEEDKKTLAAADSTVKGGRTVRVARKKRSIGLMEDLWDESVFEDPARTTTATRTTPVIKISFGAQGEGTVLKIPSKIQNPYLSRDMDTDTEETQTELDRDPLELPNKRHEAGGFGSYHRRQCDPEEDGQEQVDPQRHGHLIKDCETASAKAAKKALKKAKKKALRKMYGATSPARSPCNGSPRYNSNFDKMLYHRRKHKVKHKKKHKEERKHKSQAQSVEQPDCSTADSGQVAVEAGRELDDSSAYTAIKEQCLKQKLSISLKRLNTNAYTARCDRQQGYPVSNASSGCKSCGATSDEEDEECEHETGVEVAVEIAPDFPPPEHPLVMRLSAAATTVGHCLTSNGRRMDVGDVVWGKVHGFPWWPGKVLSITNSTKEDGTQSGPQAHVAWYGSSTSSLMSCDQLSPFLETFKTRYNKKKKGPYKEAIRQAQSEARSQVAPNSTGNVLDVCGSPREVNVLS